MFQCGALVQQIGHWTLGPGVLPAGCRPPDLERKKYLWDALCLPPTRRSEVGSVEPEIWRSPNQKHRPINHKDLKLVLRL